MLEKTKYTSSSLERQVATYLKPRTYMMFTAERGNLLRGKSEHASVIIEKYYESLTPNHQAHLIDKYEKINKK